MEENNELIKKEIEKHFQIFIKNLNKIYNNNFNNIKLFEYIKIEVCNKFIPISKISYIKTDEKNNIIITPNEIENIKKIENAIKNINLSISYINLGKSIKIINSILTEDKKKKIIKLFNIEKEKIKIIVRNIRNKFNKKIKENHKNNIEIKLNNIQKIINEYIFDINKVIDKKIKNL